VSRRTLAFVGIGICSLAVLSQNWILGKDHQSPWFIWVPILAVLGWSMWQLRERPDPESKAFDFNPKRGVLYFFLGFLIFPFMLAMDAIFGTQISLLNAAIVTAGGSAFIGLVGTFTEHVGV
jgi:hypothetical protein